MRKQIALLVQIFAVCVTLHGSDRELTLARELLEDAIVRDDVEGIDHARGRLLRLAASADDRSTLRDAHYLVALSTLFESYSGYRDGAAIARVVATGVRHADRAIEIDPSFADAWMVSASLRRRTVDAAPDLPGAPNRFMRAVELDPKSPAVAFVNAMAHSLNPAGAAPPEGVKLFDELAQRLDAERAASGRRFGLWDAEAHAWRILTRMASDEPNAETLRPLATRLLEQRPDFALARMIADAAAERRFAAAPSLEWKPFLVDSPGDGKDPKLPDVVRVDQSGDHQRAWFRVVFRERLPRSFGVNIVVDRSGEGLGGTRWWGDGSAFRFDRLVTAWISRDGDRYFGRVGVTDDDGARGARLSKIPGEILLAMGDDDRALIIGVPRAALGMTERSAVIVAGGSHLVWNDDATSAANSR